ncbi:CueP family metal-binding protein [Vibrio gangliei]|uniref:CueP family metal-binding protein n=1 Tax=Vibrio gangliei TaxID=2077090 RepID=UPI000D017298|nr:CueP family metal-binding protein [Vibrio gangliei]
MTLFINKSNIITTTIATVLAVFALSAQASEADNFKGLTAEQALEKSHQYHGKGTASVQVMPNVLVAKFSDGSQVQIPTKDKHLLSIAPYENQTHPCGYHVPTGCQGEMVEKTMMIKVVDLDSKQVLKYGQVTTQKDGFIDLWMPKDRKHLQVTFTYQGKASTEVLSTVDDARTCITTMQLI